MPSTAPYPGHDEWSTAIAYQYGQDLQNPGNPNPIPIAWQGQYMADDFADYAGTPVVHVRWWGSYQNNQAYNGVQKFLISFEHDIPAAPDPSNPNVIIPSHPDFNNPNNVSQIVDLAAAGLPPAGFFTSKPIYTPPGGVPSPDGTLWEYNAELHPDKWFNEQSAAHGGTSGTDSGIYWLKIVALVNPSQDGPIQWGWHDRDWSIPDALAAVPPDVVPGEHIQGYVPGPGGLQPVWHFQDDAVQGGVNVLLQPGMATYMPYVQQDGFTPQNYLYPYDGPSGIEQYSKDLSFELYTLVPEPASFVLMGLGVVALQLCAGNSAKHNCGD